MDTIARVNKSVNDTPSSGRTAHLDPQAIPRLVGDADRILALLLKAGAAGCLNTELWAHMRTHYLTQRINDLKKRGHVIIAKPEGENGLWRYRLINESQKQTAPPVAKPPSFEERHRREEAERFPLFTSVGER